MNQYFMLVLGTGMCGMTTDQEAAAKWQIVEDFKKTKERLEVLREKVTKWGARYNELGQRMKIYPDKITEGEGASLPDAAEFAQTVRDLKEANGAYETLLNRMRGIGLEPKNYF